MTTPLTPELLDAYAVQLELVPKRSYMLIKSTTIDAQGNGVVVLHTDASPEAVISWFRKAHLTVIRSEWLRDDDHYRRITFQVEPQRKGRG